MNVSRLSIAPVKGMALLHPDEVRLERYGVPANRRFHVIDATGRRYGQIRDGTLVRIVPEYDDDADRLTLRFPDGSAVAGKIALGGAINTNFHGRWVKGHVVEGPWADAIAAYAGKPLRLVKTDEPGAGVDRGQGPVSLLADESLEELARRTGRDGVDARRFRMLVGIAGCRPHEEEEWLGRRVRIGGAVVLPNELVARCAITTQSPETGVPDFDTLREIKRYRGARNGKYIDFGIAGSVEEPGTVRVGDPVELD